MISSPIQQRSCLPLGARKARLSSLAWRNSNGHGGAGRHNCRTTKNAAAPPGVDAAVAAIAEGLPIAEVIGDVVAALDRATCAVLQAPPGAGKTTAVPLALLAHAPAYLKGGKRVLVLEPRRVAAKAAARRMAAMLRERVGATVGYAVRLERRVSASTRVEVVTEGVLLRRLQRGGAALDGVGAILFDEVGRWCRRSLAGGSSSMGDAQRAPGWHTAACARARQTPTPDIQHIQQHEQQPHPRQRNQFHERNLDADLALALALDAQRWDRPDLRLLVMSATLGGGLAERVAELMAECLGDAAGGGNGSSSDASGSSGAASGTVPVIVSEGRSFPVQTVYLGAPPRRDGGRLERAVADAVLAALARDAGDVLAFLPGAAEIRRTQRLLLDELPSRSGVRVLPLHGNLAPERQDAAIRPDPGGARRVVLATPIAESRCAARREGVVQQSPLLFASPGPHAHPCPSRRSTTTFVPAA